MRKYFFFAVIVTVLLSTGYAQDRSVIGKVKKVMVFEMKGQGADAKPTVNLFSVPLSRYVQYVGYAESVTGQVVKLTRTDWVDDQFNGSNGFYFLEILSGPDIRAITDITDTFGPEGSIVTADDMSAYLTDKVKVRIGRHHTLFSVFGEDNRMGFTPGAVPREADEVILFNADTQRPSVYYFSSKVAAWVDASSPLQPIGDFIIYPDQGLFLKRRGLGSLPLVFVGDVRVEPIATRVVPGINVLANIPPEMVTFILPPADPNSAVIDTRTAGLPKAASVMAKKVVDDGLGGQRISQTTSSAWVQKMGLNRTDRIHVIGDTAFIFEQDANAPPTVLLLQREVQPVVGGAGNE